MTNGFSGFLSSLGSEIDKLVEKQRKNIDNTAKTKIKAIDAFYVAYRVSLVGLVRLLDVINVFFVENSLFKSCNSLFLPGPFRNLKYDVLFVYDFPVLFPYLNSSSL